VLGRARGRILHGDLDEVGKLRDRTKGNHIIIGGAGIGANEVELEDTHAEILYLPPLI
jgi:hypothetical protein